MKVLICYEMRSQDQSASITGHWIATMKKLTVNTLTDEIKTIQEDAEDRYTAKTGTTLHWQDIIIRSVTKLDN